MEKLEERTSVILSNEGQKIFGILHQPLQAKKPPVVLFCHGMGGQKTGRFRVYVDLAERLIQSNIAVFRFDFRGSGDSEGQLSRMSIKGMLGDTGKVLEYLVKRPDLDANRLAIFGRSLGASLALLASAEFGDIKSAALWAPLYDGDQWKEQWEQVLSGKMSEADSREIRRVNGQVLTLDFYKEMFSMPINEALLKLNKMPLLLIHGEVDTRIAIEHSEKYEKYREKTGAKQTKLVRLAHTDHDFSHTPERLLAIDETVHWFENTL